MYAYPLWKDLAQVGVFGLGVPLHCAVCFDSILNWEILEDPKLGYQNGVLNLYIFLGFFRFCFCFPSKNYRNYNMIWFRFLSWSVASLVSNENGNMVEQFPSLYSSRFLSCSPFIFFLFLIWDFFVFVFLFCVKMKYVISSSLCEVVVASMNSR